MVVGFDVSKASINWAVVNKAGKVTSEGVVPNRLTDLSALLKRLHSRHRTLSCAVESTGVYHLPVLRACEQLGLPCRLINPIQTKQFTLHTVRGTKTDRTDARYIALLGLRGAGYVVMPVDDVTAKARAYLRLATRLQATHTKLELTRQYLDRTGLDLDNQALNALQAATKTAVSAYRAEAAALLKDALAVTLLQGLPGIGELLATGIVSEIGDLSRFRTAMQLVAYAGLDPKIKQSGAMSTTGHLTKRGSPYLRRYLYLAAMQARLYDPELKLAHARQRERGKSYTVATICIARRLVHRIFAVLKRGTPYEVRSS